mmetsp:Transcript_18625/g.47733  ORF Transcript_18625/g.47733 Transcript_18625/m.47733 type:complete len:262 (+) Transcript_18625:390-1175(+)
MSSEATADEKGGQYIQHWDGVYANKPEQHTREWHCEYSGISSLLKPYICHAAAGMTSCSNASKPLVLMDIGCGGSTIAADIRADFPDLGMQLHLLDISSVIIDALKQRYAGDSAVVCDVADCRTLPTGNGAVDVVVDKGTLDALHGDEDKLACMRECQRVLHPRGVLISISFGAARRMAFLQQSAGMLGLELHMHVVGDGDPASGHQVVFVAMLAEDLSGCGARSAVTPPSYLTPVHDRSHVISCGHDNRLFQWEALTSIP